MTGPGSGANIEHVSANVRSPVADELLAEMHLQGSLFGTVPPSVDESFTGPLVAGGERLEGPRGASAR